MICLVTRQTVAPQQHTVVLRCVIYESIHVITMCRSAGSQCYIVKQVKLVHQYDRNEVCTDGLGLAASAPLQVKLTQIVIKKQPCHIRTSLGNKPEVLYRLMNMGGITEKRLQVELEMQMENQNE